jgi:haloacid dehalogenase superfamily, subfamily IA, variant 3 with third motif having DD or ED
VIGGPIDLVIFDCDGVLVDSEVLSAQVLAAEVMALGLPLTTEDCLARFTGLSMRAVLAAIEADLGRPLPPAFEEHVRAADERVFRGGLKAIDGVAVAVGALPGRVCVASSGALAKMRFTLGLTGLLPLFEPNLFSAGMVARGKPAPDLFLFAAREMDVSPAACLVVEDSVAGVTAAVAAGMRVLGFAGGGHCRGGYRQCLRDAGAATVFDRMADLPTLVAEAAAQSPDSGSAQR